MANYDIIGDIAILHAGMSKKEKLGLAKQLLKRKNIKTVLEKQDKVKGRLRTIKTKHLIGEKKKETIHKENNCIFKLDVETCYFSPRLAEDRKELAGKTKRKDKALVMFAGVGPYGIVIGKKGCKVKMIELGKACCKYAKENVKKNKVSCEMIQGDVKKIIKKGGLIVKGNLVPLQFDVIIMPRPNLKESFLNEAFLVSKKGTRIFYYCFGRKKELGKSIEAIFKISKRKKKKIKIEKIKKVGEIAPYKFRWRIDFRIL